MINLLKNTSLQMKKVFKVIWKLEVERLVILKKFKNKSNWLKMHKEKVTLNGTIWVLYQNHNNSSNNSNKTRRVSRREQQQQVKLLVVQQLEVELNLAVNHHLVLKRLNMLETNLTSQN